MKIGSKSLPCTLPELRRWVAGIRGVCLTYAISGHERRKHGMAGRREQCLVAYAGEGRKYCSQRFALRRYGIQGAAAQAMRWRVGRTGLSLSRRTCDRPRRERN